MFIGIYLHVMGKTEDEIVSACYNFASAFEKTFGSLSAASSLTYPAICSRRESDSFHSFRDDALGMPVCIVAEGCVALIFLLISCVCNIYRAFSNRCPHCGKIRLSNGKYCSMSAAIHIRQHSALCSILPPRLCTPRDKNRCLQSPVYLRRFVGKEGEREWHQGYRASRWRSAAIPRNSPPP